ncbi:hypothetical protein KW790_02025 [Candidatus Parcubacteria bacterium]|nr:hypothetical protein [Candidatus Parcubacteria bacterium]
MKRILPVALLLLVLTPVFSNAQSSSACTPQSSISDSACISLIQELLAQIAVLQKLILQIISNQGLTATKPNDVKPSIPIDTSNINASLPTINNYGKDSIVSGESATFQLGKYPKTAAKWVLTVSCPVGININQKGGGCSSGTMDTIILTNGDPTIENWSITATNLTSYKQTVVATFGAFDSVGKSLGKSQATLTVLPPNTVVDAAPTVDIKVSQTTWDGPITIPYNTAEFLAWTSTNASYCYGSKTGSGTWGGSLPLSGTQTTGSITSNTTFTVTCQDASGRVASDSIVFNVQNAISSGPTVDLKVGDSDGPITVPSNTTKNLSWNSTNASHCSGYSSGPGVWGGVMALSGTISTGNITTGTTFTINCQNATGQNASDSIIINVGAVTTTGSGPIVSLYANNSSVSPGTPVTLNWSSNDTSTNTAYCYSQQFQTNNALRGQVIVYPQTTTLYEVTCNNQYGSSKASATVSVNSVSNAPVSVSLSASPSTISLGQSTRLSWTVSDNATSCTKSWGGNTSPMTGYQDVYPTSGTSYTITCYNGNSSQSAYTTVSLIPASTVDEYTVGYNQTSSISLSSSEKTAVYEYPSSPCGTLMTQFLYPGSVSASGGPVYNAAAAQCSTTAGNTPNTATFRVYSCQNFSDPSTTAVRARATFAFQCLLPYISIPPSTPPTTNTSGGVHVSMSGNSDIANVLSGVQALLNSISAGLNQ